MLCWSIFFILLSVSYADKRNGSICDKFQANFDIKSVIGTWHVVAIIPDKMYPEMKEVTCHSVEFSETDEASLRWLVNQTIEKLKKHGHEFEDHNSKEAERINGLIIRQHYDYGESFDLWAKAIEGFNGCFKQILTMDMIKSDFDKVSSHDAMMQLHMIHTDEEHGPFLVQMLWGKLISAVVYRKNMGVTQDELRPVFELLCTLRGPQRLPKICEVPVNKLLAEKHKDNDV